MRPCKIIVERLCNLYWPNGPSEFYRGITLEEFLRHRPANEYLGDFARYAADDAWHFSRARFFYDELLAGRTLDPISIDNRCDGGNIYAQPVLLDGHHRLGASLLAGVRVIPAHYGGRIDLRDYLTGRRRTCPTD